MTSELGPLRRSRKPEAESGRWLWCGGGVSSEVRSSDDFPLYAKLHRNKGKKKGGGRHGQPGNVFEKTIRRLSATKPFQALRSAASVPHVADTLTKPTIFRETER